MSAARERIGDAGLALARFAQCAPGMGNPVQTFRNNLKSLHRAQHTRDRARNAEHREAKQVKGDAKALKKDQAALKSDQKKVDPARKNVEQLKAAEASQLQPLDRQIADVQTQLQNTGLTPEQIDALNTQLAQLQQNETQIKDSFDPRIATAKQKVDQLRTQISRDRDSIKHDRTEKKKDEKTLKRDKQRLDKAMKQVKRAYARAKKHLRPAEEHMNLKQTNEARKALGMKPVNHVIRPPNLNTVQGCAQFLLSSKNVHYWSGLSSGSDIKNIRLLAQGKPAFVPATGGHVFPKLSLMQALVDMAKHGPIQINALTGGVHTPGSNHYRGTAVDLDINVGNTSEIVAIANRHGGVRNFETSHIHLDF